MARELLRSARMLFRSASWAILSSVVACSLGLEGPEDHGASGTAAGGPSGDGGSNLIVGSGGTMTEPSCEPPDMLVVLDRTLSMHRTPDGKTPDDTPLGHSQSKWWLAVGALENVSAPPTDAGIRFGLELFPRDPGNGECITLSQRIQGKEADNPSCESGELLVGASVDAGTSIAASIDPETTLLCTSTPVGAALVTAKSELAAIADPIRDQYVLLVTDGNDTCAPDDGPEPLEIVKELAALEVKTYVVGFGLTGGDDGVNVKLLNDLACAGLTAESFATSCSDVGDGYEATSAGGPPLYFDAADGDALRTGLEAIAAEVGCGSDVN